MAKQRIVNTHFWRDSYILGLKPDERLLFLWVITNPSTDLCGAYEAAMPSIELETGLKGKRIVEIFAEFARAGKILYRDGWVIIRNFTKHQNGTSTNIKKGAERSLSGCPDWVKDTLSKGIAPVSKDTLPEPRPEPEPEPTVVFDSGVNADEIEFVGEVLDGIRTRQKLNVIRDEAGWSDTAIFARTNNFSPTQVFDCYDLLKQQKWRRGPVTANVVATNLENLDNLRIEIKEQVNGNSSKKTNTGRKRDSGDSEQSTKDFLASIGASPAL